MAKLSQKIGKLTNSIVNRLSGDSFDTDVLKLTGTELKNLKKAWKFDWGTEFRKRDATVYKLVIDSSPDIIQGLVSLELDSGFVAMPLDRVCST